MTDIFSGLILKRYLIKSIRYLTIGWLTLVVTAFLLIQANSAYAVDIKLIGKIPTDYPGNNEPLKWGVQLSGPFVSGDNRKIETFLSVRSFVPFSTCVGTNCKANAVTWILNSTGGDFMAAINIANNAKFGKFATVVNKSHVCLSACSILFMAGETKKLYLGAKLGFHAPFLAFNAPGGQMSFTFQEINSAYDAAKEVLASLVDLAARGRISSSLLSIILNVPRDEFYYIDSIDKVGRWDIDIADMPYVRISSASIKNACINKFSWIADQFSETFDNVKIASNSKNGPVKSFQAENGELKYAIGVEDQGNGNVGHCLFEIIKEGKRDYTKCQVNYVNIQHRSLQGRNFECDELVFYPAKTGLNQKEIYDVAKLLSREPLVSNFNYTFVDFTTHQNKNLSYKGYRAIEGLIHQQCTRRCGSDKQCEGYTYDRWDKVCILKTGVGILRTDPRVISGVRYSSPVIHDPGQVVMRKILSKTFPKYPADETYQARSFEQCSAYCLRNDDCGAFNFTQASGACRIISSPEKYTPSATDDIGIKIQKIE